MESLHRVAAAISGLQVFPNLVGLIGLSGVVAAMLRGDRSGGESEA